MPRKIIIIVKEKERGILLYYIILPHYIDYMKILSSILMDDKFLVPKPEQLPQKHKIYDQNVRPEFFFEPSVQH